jgi:deoxycytidylate deaminase
MTNKERSLFRIAKNISSLSDFRVKIGAVLYYKHKVVGSGANSNTATDIIQAKLDKENYGCECPGKLHAESSVLIPFIKRGIDISGSELFIYRERKDGSLGMARPCQSCMKLIKQCGIKKIYYSTYDGYATEMIV